MIRVTVDGLPELRRTLAGLGFSDRRFAATVATALTRTAVKVQADMRQELRTEFDRPTPFTLNALRVWPATAARPEARVGFRDDGTGGMNANNYLLPNVEGGERREKRLEAALRALGALPEGWRITPGQGARLDEYGNVSRGQVIQVLSQLRVQLVGGFNRNLAQGAKGIAALRKAGGRFFVIPPGRDVQPGVYQRELLGRNITPVFIFVRPPRYRARWPFWDRAQQRAARYLQPEVSRAVSEQIARLAAKGKR